MSGDDEKEFNHESYVMVGFNRITGDSGRLFGSSLPNQHTFIRLHVVKGRRIHNLGRDWYHGEATPIIEVDLSAAQFAELLTSMNVGSGVPGTLRVLNGEQIAKAPEEKLEAEQVRGDFKEKVRATASKLNESVKEIETILAKPAIGKADREAIKNKLGMLIQEVRSNMPFWLDQFHEATGKIITSAKAEVDSFMTNAIMSAGFKALTKQNAPIEVPAMLTNGAGPDEDDDHLK